MEKNSSVLCVSRSQEEIVLLYGCRMKNILCIKQYNDPQSQFPKSTHKKKKVYSFPKNDYLIGLCVKQMPFIYNILQYHKERKQHKKKHID